VGFIPAAVFGVLFDDKIDALLESAITVGISLLVGGVIFLFVDKWFNHETEREETPSFLSAFKIGFFQVIAMVPGVSRSAATIIGGLSQKLTRTAAAEFSFFLAIPTMLAATAKKMFDHYKDGTLQLDTTQINTLLIGNVVAFVIAMLSIKIFITYLTRHGFKLFGYYRIVVGLLIISFYFLEIPLTIF
jgi:undecaprenyl-diphosphatase